MLMIACSRFVSDQIPWRLRLDTQQLFTFQPLVASRPTAFSTTADIRTHHIPERTALRRDLMPPAAGFHVIDSDIPAFEQCERLLNTLAVIELRAPFLAEGLEP